MNGKYERIYYTKGENEVTIDNRVEIFIVDVTENEMKALEMVRTLNGGTFEKAEEIYERENSFNTEKEELIGEINSLKSEKEEF